MRTLEEDWQRMVEQRITKRGKKWEEEERGNFRSR